MPPVVGEDGKACISAGMSDKDACGESCGPDPICCGYLHAMLPLVRDQYIDNVDELTLERLHNQIEFEEVLDSINSEIGQLTMDLEYFTFMTSGMK